MRWWATVNSDGTKRVWRGTRKPEKIWVNPTITYWLASSTKMVQVLGPTSSACMDSRGVIRALFPKGLKRGECVELQPPERFKIK